MDSVTPSPSASVTRRQPTTEYIDELVVDNERMFLDIEVLRQRVADLESRLANSHDPALAEKCANLEATNKELLESVKRLREEIAAQDARHVASESSLDARVTSGITAALREVLNTSNSHSLTTDQSRRENEQLATSLADEKAQHEATRATLAETTTKLAASEDALRQLKLQIEAAQQESVVFAGRVAETAARGSEDLRAKYTAMLSSATGVNSDVKRLFELFFDEAEKAECESKSAITVAAIQKADIENRLNEQIAALRREKDYLARELALAKLTPEPGTPPPPPPPAASASAVPSIVPAISTPGTTARVVSPGSPEAINNGGNITMTLRRNDDGVMLTGRRPAGVVQNPVVATPLPTPRSLSMSQSQSRVFNGNDSSSNLVVHCTRCTYDNRPGVSNCAMCNGALH